jgi:hypothetical protein
MTCRTARCHCGQLEIDCTGEPARISLCHCVECQRRTGSIFSLAAFYQRANVNLTRGAANNFQRPSASGFPVLFHFCPNCGANLYWEPARLPHLIGVAAGAFADPTFPAPHQSVWTKDKHAWLHLPPGTKTFDINPPPRPLANDQG